MATSGLVLFSKEFLHAIPQPRLIGSLLTAILEFSAKTTGAPVSYMEFTNVAVTIVVNESAKVFCAIFFDVADGPKFGAFLAKEILAAFVDEYAGDLGNIGHNLRDFHGFHYKISEVIRESVKPILSTSAARHSKSHFGHGRRRHLRNGRSRSIGCTRQYAIIADACGGHKRQCTFNYNSRCKELKHPSPSD
ncbi:hypothetical protein Ae201684P_001406 [Aphanomyces euteiches]|nr:hypothetical protein Ae201684P_001406 [Aphanomyces euteiches]